MQLSLLLLVGLDAVKLVASGEIVIVVQQFINDQNTNNQVLFVIISRRRKNMLNHDIY